MPMVEPLLSAGLRAADDEAISAPAVGSWGAGLRLAWLSLMMRATVCSISSWSKGLAM